MVTLQEGTGSSPPPHPAQQSAAVSPLPNVLEDGSRFSSEATPLLVAGFFLECAMFFPVVMYGCESWTVKKAEHRRTDAFELWCWRRLLRVPGTARRSNQSILKEISPECSLEGLTLKLKL